MSQRPDGCRDLPTPTGQINTAHIANYRVFAAREVGQMSGIHLPVQPTEHHCLITDRIRLITTRTASMGEAGRLPAGIAHEANKFFRQERQGMELGTRELKSKPSKVDGTPRESRP